MDDEGVGLPEVSDDLRRSANPVFILSPVRDDSGTIIDLTYVFLNDAALSLYRKESVDLVGWRVLDVFPSYRGNGIFDADAQAIDTQLHVDIDVPWIDENGVQGAFTWHATPHGDGVMAIAVNVTATKLAERDRQYHLLAEGAGNVVLTHGMDGLTDWVSPSVTEVLGWSRDRFMSVPHRDLIHPEDRAAMVPVQAALRHSKASPGRVEVRFASADGLWRWMSVVTRAIRDDQGHLTGAVEVLQDIQAEVEFREALVSQAARLELALEGSGLGMWDIDLLARTGVCDERCAEIVGFSLAELPPLTMESWVALTHPDDLDSADQASEAHLAGLTASVDTEVRLRHRDGSWVWVRIRGRIVERSAEGLPLRVMGTIEDTTHRVEGRQALERSEQALQDTQRMARLGSWTIDAPTGRAEWSDELFELFGMDPHHPAPGFAEQERLFVAESWVLVSDAVAEALATGVPYDLELEIVRADGGHGWIHARGEALRDERGLVVSLLGYALDVTERRQAEQSLAASEALFRTAMLASPVGLAMTELDGSFRVVNESLCRLLGRDEGWLLEHKERDVTHPDDVEQVARERATEVAREPDAGFDAEMKVFRFLHADGRHLWMKQAAELISGGAGRPDYLLVQYAHTTAEHDALDELAYQAFHDPLTGLRNRAWIMDQLECDLRDAPTGGGTVGVLFIDLDNFKIVNDSLGHAAGDEVLMTVADRIAGILRPKDRVGRSGGDEFIVIVPDFKDAQEAELVAQRIVSAVGTELTIRGHRIVPTVSIGIALNVQGATSSSLLRDADAALFRAKAAGRSRWRFFDDTMHAEALARLVIEDEIRRGLDKAEFVVHYQPIVALTDRSVVGYEALVRWHHPTRGLLSPISFLPTAEDSGLIEGIGQQVLDQVCALLAAHPDLPGSISVNFSPVQLARAGWFAGFTVTLARHRVDPRRVVVEVTETAVMSLLAGTRADLTVLRDLGVGIHVDDFGTGFSSISLLRDLPVTGIKLDASFVADLSSEDDAASALSSGLAGLVRGLHLRGIAEGVESEAQHRILLRHGWSHAQGYVYARPAPEPLLAIPTTVR